MGLITLAWHPPIWVAAAALLLVIIYLVAAWALAALRPRDFPPGPAPIPVLGNALQLPTHNSFLRFHEWKATYGDIVGLKIGRQDFVLLQSAEHVRELLEKRGAVYSERPRPYIPSEIIARGSMLFMGNDHSIRKTRTGIRSLAGASELPRALGVQAATAGVLMRRILREPAELRSHVRYWALATPLALLCGQRVEEQEDGTEKKGGSIGGPTSTETYFETQERWLRFLDPARAPPVEMFPVIKYLPEALAQWKRKAVELRDDMLRMRRHMLEGAKAGALCIAKGVRGADKEPVMAKLMREGEEASSSSSSSSSSDMRFGDDEMAIFGSATLDASVDTTISTFCSFVLALGAFPEVRRRVQAELDGIWGDEVPGPERLAEAKYLRACLMEIIRWRGPAAQSLPRMLARDDTYRGFRFRKGTTFLINVWSIHSEEEWYDEPEEFRPERYLENRWGVRPSMAAEAERTGRRPTYGFGAGRRICPGMEYAENQVLMATAKVAWGFDIVPRGPGPVDCGVETAFHFEFVVAPKIPMEVDFVPRSQARSDKIVEDSERAEKLLSEWVD